MMIVLNKVIKSFQGKTVLNGVSMQLAKGEAVGLLGPSGAGKTTMLNLIAQLQQPDRGHCSIAARHIGYVFQHHRLLPWKTALENVLFALAALPKAGEPREMQHMAHAALNAVGLKDAADRFPGQLSGGMCQRVSIARALVIRPDILLLDEPFSALDHSRKQQMRFDLKRMLQERPNMTVVYVTHNPYDLQGITQKTYFLDNGHLSDQT